MAKKSIKAKGTLTLSGSAEVNVKVNEPVKGFSEPLKYVKPTAYFKHGKLREIDVPNNCVGKYIALHITDKEVFERDFSKVGLTLEPTGLKDLDNDVYLIGRNDG